MSKFQIVLTYIKKYIFWVIALVCLLMTFITGSAVTGSKKSAFEARKTAIEGKFSEMQGLIGQDTPNEMVVDQKKKDVENLKENILDAWGQLYQPQALYFENLWPDFKNVKGETDAEADHHIEALKAAWREQTIFDPANNIDSAAATAYYDYIKRFQMYNFMTRYKIYNPQFDSVQTEGAMGGGMVGNQIQEAAGGISTDIELPAEGMCTWDEANRLQMLQHINILSHDRGTREVLIVQEDLNVYDILLRAIYRMNEKCEGSHDAIVKRIFQIDVARDASTLNEGISENGRTRSKRMTLESEGDQNITFNAAERVVSVAEPQKSTSEELGEGEIPPEVTEGGDEEGSSKMKDVKFEELFDYRYCDSYGNFMSAADLAAYLTTKPEYIMMPVHVKILINQKKIPQFLLNCLNSEVPIYIHQISMQARVPDCIVHHLDIVPPEEATGENDEESGMGTISRASSRSERMMPSPMSENAGEIQDELTNGNASNATTDKRKPEDVEFEMWGMICLFSKPDESKFEKIVGAEEPAEDEGNENADEDSGSAEDAEDSEDVEDAEDDDSEDVDAENPEDSEENPEAAEDEAAAENSEDKEETEPSKAQSDDKTSADDEVEAVPSEKAEEKQSKPSQDKEAGEETVAQDEAEEGEAAGEAEESDESKK